MDHKLKDNDLNQRDMVAASIESIPDVSRRTLLKAGAVTGGTLAISGCASTGDAQPDDVPPEDNEPEPTKGVDDIRVPQLHLDTLEATVAGETLQAVSYEDWRPGSTTFVGQVSGPRSANLFVAVSLLGDDAEQYSEMVVYLCNGEIGDLPDIGIYLTGDYEAGGVTLTDERVSSADEAVEVKMAVVDGTVLGALTLSDGEQAPFIATEATGDAGYYRAESEGENLVAQWVVLPDGRQRGYIEEEEEMMQ